jgi:hypothetical protein
MMLQRSKWTARKPQRGRNRGYSLQAISIQGATGKAGFNAGGGALCLQLRAQLGSIEAGTDGATTGRYRMTIETFANL